MPHYVLIDENSGFRVVTNNIDEALELLAHHQRDAIENDQETLIGGIKILYLQAGDI